MSLQDTEGHANVGVRIAVSDFVKRQTPSSPYSHFEGTWEELIALTVDSFCSGVRNGYKPGVLLVDVPADRFWSSTVCVTPETKLRAEFSARRESEAKFISVRAQGEKTKAKYAFVVLYSHSVLGEEATSNADFEIVSINARLTPEDEPMDPMTMARNFLHLEGGTKGDFTAQQFAESIVYWSSRALLERQP